MRLLQLQESGDVQLTADLHHDIPPYAILSHTWGNEEVTFKDLGDKTGRNKSGYQKLLFCGRQATRDGLHYFWVDTCCIDKSNNAELAEAIISMFRWYRNAAKCYAFLADIESSSDASETTFCASKWFSRGWTLQELIAPPLVDFYSRDGSFLGTKVSREAQIQTATGIDKRALRGCDLSEFSVQERLSWAESRQTTREEDKAYCLLGLFGINMVPMYGEGVTNAFSRLNREIRALDVEGTEERSKISEWLSPSAHQRAFKPIERASGTCEWLFNVDLWRTWSQSITSAVLWIKGGPGVGKTVLTSAAVEKMNALVKEHEILAVFHCSSGDNNRNNARSIVSSLARQLLVNLKQSTPAFVQEQYNRAIGSGYKNDGPLLGDAREMLGNLHEHYTSVTYFIDGIDECAVEERASVLDILLSLVQRDRPRTRLYIASRNTGDISSRLGAYPCLEVNAATNSADIQSFVQQEMTKVIRQSRLLDGQVSSELKSEIEKQLAEGAYGMFLWAKLQIAALCSATSERRLRNMLSDCPKQLKNQYDRMISLIESQEDAEEVLAKDILRWVTFTYRPCKLEEMWAALLSNGRHTSFDQDDLGVSMAVKLCHDFVEYNSASDSLSLLHSSARQYLTKHFGYTAGHADIAFQCTRYLSSCGFEEAFAETLAISPWKDDVPDLADSDDKADETARILVSALNTMRCRRNELSVIGAKYPLLDYAGRYWLQHADQGIEDFTFSDCVWMLEEKSTVFCTWRSLNSMESGYVFHVLGDLGIRNLERQNPGAAPNIIQIVAHLGLHKLLSRLLKLLPYKEYKHQALTAAACEGFGDIVRSLLSDPETLVPPGPLQAILHASSGRHAPVVTSILKALRGPAHPSFDICTKFATIGACLSPSEEMISAVYGACGCQNSEIFNYDHIKVMVSAGNFPYGHLDDQVLGHLDEINVAITDVYGLQGWSPLMIASICGNDKAVARLVDHEPYTQRDLLTLDAALTISAMLGCHGFVVQILHHVPNRIKGWMSLLMAIITNCEDIVEALTSTISPLKLALIPLKDSITTAVGEVAKTGKVSMMRILVKNGLKISTQDDNGKTPLHHAAENGHKDMLDYVFHHMAPDEIELRDADGNTALDYAMKYGSDDLVSVFEACANIKSDTGVNRKRKRGNSLHD